MKGHSVGKRVIGIQAGHEKTANEFPSHGLAMLIVLQGIELTMTHPNMNLGSPPLGRRHQELQWCCPFRDTAFCEEVPPTSNRLLRGSRYSSLTRGVISEHFQLLLVLEGLADSISVEWWLASSNSNFIMVNLN